MRKTIVLLSSLILILSITACDTGSSSSSDSNSIPKGSRTVLGAFTGSADLMLLDSNGDVMDGDPENDVTEEVTFVPATYEDGTFMGTLFTDRFEEVFVSGKIDGNNITLTSANLFKTDFDCSSANNTLSGSDGSREISLDLSVTNAEGTMSASVSFTLTEDPSLEVKELLTDIEYTESGRAVTSTTVDEFVIGSAEISAYSYSGGTFTTPVDNPDGDLVSTNALIFSADDTSTVTVNPSVSIPDQIDMVHFFCEWNAAKVGGEWFGNIADRYPTVSNAKNWADIDANSDMGASEDYTVFAVSFISDQVLSEKALFKIVHGSPDVITAVGTYSAETTSLFTELQSIVPMSSGYLDPTDDENDGKVSGNVGYVLLVPMTSINTGSIDNIILNVNLDNLIKEITDNTSDADFDYNVEYSLDSDGSPVSYSLTTD